MYFLHSSSVCPLPRYFYFSDALVSNYYIDINGIASYHIAYKEYNNILYKIDIPPSPRSSVAEIHKMGVVIHKI